MTRHCRDVQKNCSWGAAIKRNQCPANECVPNAELVKIVTNSSCKDRLPNLLPGGKAIRKSQIPPDLVVKSQGMDLVDVIVRWL